MLQKTVLKRKIIRGRESVSHMVSYFSGYIFTAREKQAGYKVSPTTISLLEGREFNENKIELIASEYIRQCRYECTKEEILGLLRNTAKTAKTASQTTN